MQKKVNALLAAVLISVGAVAGAPPAHAAYPSQGFAVCLVDELACSTYFSSGNIYWYSRTAGIDGTVNHTPNEGNLVQVVFAAFKGTTKIETQTRTVLNANESLPFNFAIGDPNLVGGIDRIRVELCEYTIASGRKSCGDQISYWRKDAQ